MPESLITKINPQNFVSELNLVKSQNINLIFWLYDTEMQQRSESYVQSRYIAIQANIRVHGYLPHMVVVFNSLNDYK